MERILYYHIQISLYTLRSMHKSRKYLVEEPTLPGAVDVITESKNRISPGEYNINMKLVKYRGEKLHT